MGIFETLRFRKRRARPVGTTLERVRDDSRGRRRKNVAAKTGIIIVLTGITLLAFSREELFQYAVQIGDTWLHESFSAPFDFAIYKPEDLIESERQAIRYSVPPIFREIPEAQTRIAANEDTLRQELGQLFTVYESYLHHSSRGRIELAQADSNSFADLRRNIRLKLTPAQWELLLDNFVARRPNVVSSTRTPQFGPPLYEVLLDEASYSSSLLLGYGVLNIALDSIYTDEFMIWNLEENTERVADKEDTYGLNEVYDYVQDYYGPEYVDQPENVNIIGSMVRAIFVPSLEYLRGETLRAWQLAERNISLTQGKVSAGEVIVERDQLITADIKQKLISFERAQASRTGSRLLWKRLLGELLLTLSTFAILFLYLFMVRRRIFDDNRQVLLIALLFSGIIGLFALAIRTPFISIYAVPVAMVSVLLTVMFDSRVGLFGTLTLSLIGGLLLGYNFEFTFATLFAGTLGVFSVRDIRNRGQFFASSGIVFLGYVIALGATWLFIGRSISMFGPELLWIAINSFLLILAYPLLWIFERSFDITTDLTLLELSDSNRPLLKELSLRAPGTFNHSLQVANLAEAAAAAIGANALLTRVGALYHDIGKMLKPEYYIENQRPEVNPHTQLKPRMSALIIASHVKEGLEMGRQYRLPKRVLDFIPMHHGTSRIEFFYRKALVEHKEDDPPLLDAEFRYPGPKPNAKEAGILMLADGVEAASRSLSEPSHKRLESLIDMIFQQRVDDDQLDDASLTFRDLKQIKETFLSLLMGIYHIRVKYPDQDKNLDKEASRTTAEDEEQSNEDQLESHLAEPSREEESSSSNGAPKVSDTGNVNPQ